MIRNWYNQNKNHALKTNRKIIKLQVNLLIHSHDKVTVEKANLSYGIKAGGEILVTRTLLKQSAIPETNVNIMTDEYD